MRLRLMLWLDTLAHRYCDWFERHLSGIDERTQHKRRLAGWSCEHMTMTASGLVSNPRSWCGCDMEPVY